MSEKLEELSAAQESAVIALLTQPTLEAAARAVGVAPRTIYRWKRQAAFVQAVRIAKSAILEGATMRLRNGALEAAETLIRLLRSQDEVIACRAAVAILQNAYRAAEVEDISERLRLVEEHFESAQLHRAGEGVRGLPHRTPEAQFEREGDESDGQGEW